MTNITSVLGKRGPDSNPNIDSNCNNQAFNRHYAINEVAKELLPEMVAMYYTNGELNNKYEEKLVYRRFFGYEDEENPVYPETLEKMAKDYEEEGLLDEAAACRAKAKVNEERRKTSIETRLQKTFFPIEISNKRYQKSECCKEATIDLASTTFYHGTSKANAVKIRREGFNVDATIANRVLTAGSAAYLTPDKSLADNYAKNGDVLSVRVQSKVKIALYTEPMLHITEHVFSAMATSYAKDQEKKILEKLTKVQGSDIEKVNDVGFSLTNLFTREFYTRQGYGGVYATGASATKAGGDFVSLFNPKEDVKSIA